ncbi:lysophospholipid acyltransferase family protein [Tateyamaria omphalii]|uniref:lysophospholipid acyltransferase family protein n=1 Tax=Tateyamaria omphalii TaxID=299262 RepID=UPI001C99CB62|nr:lysophospholipid acyltransferase family protein [Tateyamaria omphalii]MBY5934030.1 lysophospholipid acyltransferase family protein [Tateyamaria omphalii]
MRHDPEVLPWQTRLAYLATNAVARGCIGAALALPYKWRVPFMGWILSHIVGPAAGFKRRATEHIAFVLPDLPTAEHERIARESLNNAGRTLIENYSTGALLARQKTAQIDGPGIDALEQAAQTGQPVILVTGHFGNYEALRATLVGRGYDVGGLYRDMSNPYFNAHYVRTMQAFGGPVFAQGRKGTAGFVRHLKSGGQLVLLFDQHVQKAPILDFLGHPARTAVSAAELALRYKALLIPFYGIRRPDGLSFDCVMEAPIAHSDPETMTQAMNDSIGARIRANPEQWLWVARRWRTDEYYPDMTT